MRMITVGRDLAEWSAVIAIMVMVSGTIVLADQAVAPPSIIAHTVIDIPKGSKAGVGPEALIIDEGKKVWINKHHPVSVDAGMVVSHMPDGTYEVEITDEKLRWVKVPINDELKKALLPVSGLKVPIPAKMPSR